VGSKSGPAAFEATAERSRPLRRRCPRGFGAILVLVKRGHRMPTMNPAAATIPTLPHAGRSDPAWGISMESGVSGRGIAALSLAQATKIGPKLAEKRRGARDWATGAPATRLARAPGIAARWLSVLMPQGGLSRA
jgi:hypothetical protein